MRRRSSSHAAAFATGSSFGGRGGWGTLDRAGDVGAPETAPHRAMTADGIGLRGVSVAGMADGSGARRVPVGSGTPDNVPFDGVGAGWGVAGGRWERLARRSRSTATCWVPRAWRSSRCAITESSRFRYSICRSDCGGGVQMSTPSSGLAGGAEPDGSAPGRVPGPIRVPPGSRPDRSRCDGSISQPAGGRCRSHGAAHRGSGSGSDRRTTPSGRHPRSPASSSRCGLRRC